MENLCTYQNVRNRFCVYVDNSSVENSDVENRDVENIIHDDTETALYKKYKDLFKDSQYYNDIFRIIMNIKNGLSTNNYASSVDERPPYLISPEYQIKHKHVSQYSPKI
uniref:ATS domain-containing protein n=1 Tax=Strongyloides venezuelensis TaxID=75913 RepID=A0A0K0FEC8_STRVS